MSITQLNTADFDYAMMLNVINKSYKGKANITLSNYNTTAAPVVKVGSVFEDNGAIFIVDTADITPTGYAGITNSTTFYLYYDESASVFIYSNTAPTWSDVLQGWYNGNDRAFFMMVKDSGGTLYQSKQLLKKQGELYTKVVEIGDWNMDVTGGVVVIHGLDHTKIRDMVCMILQNSNTNIRSLTAGNGGSGNVDPQGSIDFASNTNVVLNRLTGGIFDGILYNATSFNRGFVTITYEV